MVILYYVWDCSCELEEVCAESVAVSKKIKSSRDALLSIHKQSKNLGENLKLWDQLALTVLPWRR